MRSPCTSSTRLAAKPPSSACLTRLVSTPALRAIAKASLTRGYPRNFETTQQVARSVSQLSLYGLPDSYFEQFTPMIAAVSADDVIAAARRYVDPSRLTTLIVGDYGAIGQSLDRLELGQPEMLSVEN